MKQTAQTSVCVCELDGFFPHHHNIYTARRGEAAATNAQLLSKGTKLRASSSYVTSETRRRLNDDIRYIL